ncbi:MAG TPA: MarR family winged helix-turn-helix transcriptional regulator [Steroidobacteraceae bacterium]|nr:MarR family winged helix-turn-helix transcriptional regulator [Steroidobacteraceae bacterium]
MPSSGGTKLRLQDYLPYRLSVAANSVSRLIARAYERQFDLKNPQWRLLAVLADEGPLTQQTLCGRTIMDKVTVMRAARDLLRRRLVRKLPNAEDGRSHRLMLTSAGRRLYERIVPLALAYEAQLLSGIERREIVRLERLLRRVERAAGAQCQP